MAPNLALANLHWSIRFSAATAAIFLTSSSF